MDHRSDGQPQSRAEGAALPVRLGHQRDAQAGRVPTPDLADDPSAIVELLAERTPDSVTYAGWEAIDRAERERGEPLGRPRVKFVRIGEMLEAARAGVPSSAGG